MLAVGRAVFEVPTLRHIRISCKIETRIYRHLMCDLGGVAYKDYVANLREMLEMGFKAKGRWSSRWKTGLVFPLAAWGRVFVPKISSVRLIGVSGIGPEWQVRIYDRQ
jgi:hypothetical protein